VAPPFLLSWTTSRHGDGSYAVFVDRLPVAPGHTLRDVGDQQCRRTAGCPDAAYLAQHRVYVTSSDQVEVPSLPLVSGAAGRAAQPTHTLTVVALDGRGRRRGDASWEVEIRA
jgi:hypothetical protein